MIHAIGLAPGEPGLHSIVPPRRVGGNMDIRDLGRARPRRRRWPGYLEAGGL